MPITQLSQPIAWLGAASYMIQIYFDFAGYSNMAIGLGLILGFHLPQNFNFPYASQSISEFWRRWHITLSNWFRDYLYIPLGGSRCGHLRTYTNLFTVFFLCGLWHGASLNFIFWGLYHGLFLIFERVGFRGVLAQIGRPWTHVYVIGVVLIGWVLFRSESLGQALEYLRILLGIDAPKNSYYRIGEFLRPDTALALVVGALFSCPVIPLLYRRFWTTIRQFHPAYPAHEDVINNALNIIGVMGIFLLVAMSLSAGTYNPFIYYRF